MNQLIAHTVDPSKLMGSSQDPNISTVGELPLPSTGTGGGGGLRPQSANSARSTTPYLDEITKSIKEITNHL